MADGLADYSTSPGSNVFLFPEPMPAGQVNDAARQLMADVRTFYQAPQWIDLGLAPTQVNSNTFLVTGDRTTFFPAGRRVKVDDVLTYYGTVSSSTYSAPNTSVVMNMDDGALTSSLESVSVGLVDGQTKPIPSTAIKGLREEYFTDSNFYVTGTSDTTKRVALNLDGITTETTRTLIVPDADLTLVGTDTSQTLSNKIVSSGLPVVGVSGSSAYVSLGENAENGSQTITVRAAEAVSASRVQTLQDSDGVIALESQIAMRLISSATVTSASEVIFTDLDTVTYSSFVVVIKNLLPATNLTSLRMTWSTNNGSSFISTNYGYGNQTAAANTNWGASGLSSSQSFISVGGLLSNVAGNTMNGEVHLFMNPGGRNMATWSLVTRDGSPNLTQQMGIGDNTQNLTVNAIRFAISSGSISAGTFKLYGIR